ncbi:protein phosphatase type 2A [Schizosaccharomyces octosporus yFS286]|uniref:Serine/threonine-protein phosphatase n=1 Tax=Schizosaccharomyces octosporus (strain yFS286) TaxID=483514 RepID=S9R999_SCHOY|nr:protein phosphatase type 2A [Schizosaccharomyces octosporus yFS286]EPX70694.1 protein phosphatase type 2A [Schizosaccharomyces octosporus yFS286]
MLNLDQILERLYNKQIIAEPVIAYLCSLAKEVLIQESNVVRLCTPITVVGDIHGQFEDLLEIFRIGGPCPFTNYIFLGDYVDRGYYSVETITLLLCLKLRYPKRITLLRGNHESRGITQTYGFYSECLRKYGSANVWKQITDIFDFLTLAATIDDSIFCVHGGLSPSIQHIDQIVVLDRFREFPHEGAMADLVWSDPDPSIQEFSLSPRGAGYSFGEVIVSKFLHENNMDHILRAHQLCSEGYQILFEKKLSTVWSAPNYCYRCANLASILQIDTDKSRFFNVFDAAPNQENPYVEPTAKATEYFL